MTDDLNERKIVQPAVDRATPRPWRLILGLVAVFLLCMSLVAWVLISQHSTINDLQAQASENKTAAQQLAEQVKQLGAVPVVTPAAGPAGAAGPSGLQGPKGDPGATGPAGPSGPAGPAGPSGSAGQNGVNGANGTNGTDGKTGATGAAGTQGPQGPAGPAGPTGPQGPQGEQGPPGPTCPSGYTAQSRRQGTETWWVCVADTTATATP